MSGANAARARLAVPATARSVPERVAEPLVARCANEQIVAIDLDLDHPEAAFRDDAGEPAVAERRERSDKISRCRMVRVGRDGMDDPVGDGAGVFQPSAQEGPCWATSGRYRSIKRGLDLGGVRLVLRVVVAMAGSAIRSHPGLDAAGVPKRARADGAVGCEHDGRWCVFVAHGFHYGSESGI